jgi:hypothetical protein
MKCSRVRSEPDTEHGRLALSHRGSCGRVSFAAAVGDAPTKGALRSLPSLVPGEARGRQAGAPLELPGQVALIAETHLGGDLGDAAAAAQQVLGGLDAALEQVG